MTFLTVVFRNILNVSSNWLELWAYNLLMIINYSLDRLYLDMRDYHKAEILICA